MRGLTVTEEIRTRVQETARNRVDLCNFYNLYLPDSESAQAADQLSSGSS